MTNENENGLVASEDTRNEPKRIILNSPDDTISLKQLIPDDAQLYFDLVDFDRDHLSQNEDVTASKYPTVDAVRMSIKKPASTNKYRFGIWDGDKMVGSDNLTLKENNMAELGSWVGKEHIGHNYAARARKLLVDFAFNQLGLDEVFCEIVVGNIASRKSVEKSGFVYEGEKDGKWIFTLRRN